MAAPSIFCAWPMMGSTNCFWILMSMRARFTDETREVVRAQLVARVGRLRGVDVRAVGELPHERHHERDPGQHEQQGDAALSVARRPHSPSVSVTRMRASVE